MSEVGYLAACTLATMFAWAGLSKFRSPVRTASTFRALGLPAPATLARAVPATEFAIAAALVTVTPAGATAALTALAFFTTVLVGRLRAGSQVSCGCFGTATDRPISFVEPLRNALLAALAVTALGASGPVAPGIDAVIATSTAVLVGALILALASLRRDVGAIWRTSLAGEPVR
jgi:uncharacterized membrane protein YphA (DoxX/SURF4 family)